MQNYIYKIINSEEEHNFKDYLTKNRTIRMLKQNKVGHHDQYMGHSQFTQNTFLYRAVNIFNKLPRNITLIKQPHLFKLWCKRYNLNNNIKLKQQEDNVKIIIQPITSQINLLNCMDFYEMDT